MGALPTQATFRFQASTSLPLCYNGGNVPPPIISRSSPMFSRFQLDHLSQSLYFLATFFCIMQIYSFLLDRAVSSTANVPWPPSALKANKQQIKPFLAYSPSASIILLNCFSYLVASTSLPSIHFLGTSI